METFVESYESRWARFLAMSAEEREAERKRVRAAAIDEMDEVADEQA